MIENKLLVQNSAVSTHNTKDEDKSFFLVFIYFYYLFYENETTLDDFQPGKTRWFKFRKKTFRSLLLYREQIKRTFVIQ